MEGHLEDDTTDGILSDPEKRAEVVAAIAFKAPRKSSAGTSVEGAVAKFLAQVRRTAEALPDGEEGGEEERPAKKAKKGKGGEGAELEAYARAMLLYDRMKSDDLKGVVRWNLGYGTTGNKDVLMLR